MAVGDRCTIFIKYLAVVLMPLSAAKTYSCHSNNLRKVKAGLDATSRNLKRAIAQRDYQTAEVFLRIYTLLAGAWSEVRLSKMIFEAGGFSPEERNTIRSKNRKIDEWKKCVELAVRSQYNVPQGPLTAAMLPENIWEKYSSILGIIDPHLNSVIEMRNKLAHGQWENVFNSSGSNLNLEKGKELRAENYLTVTHKISIIDALSNIVHDLIVSQPTFERDFNIHYRQLRSGFGRLKNQQYQEFENKLIASKNKNRHLRHVRKNTVQGLRVVKFWSWLLVSLRGKPASGSKF